MTVLDFIQKLITMCANFRLLMSLQIHISFISFIRFFYLLSYFMRPEHFNDEKFNAACFRAAIQTSPFIPVVLQETAPAPRKNPPGSSTSLDTVFMLYTLQGKACIG